MAVVRWDPWSELATLQRDVSELFNRTLPQSASRQPAALVPPIDAVRTDEGLVVRVELPGMNPDDVEVSVDDGVLTISGERAYDRDVADDQWVRRERAFGTFQRSFSLPDGTDPGAIGAEFENGVLELRIPHPPERRPHRVEIAGATNGQGETVEVADQSASS